MTNLLAKWWRRSCQRKFWIDALLNMITPDAEADMFRTLDYGFDINDFQFTAIPKPMAEYQDHYEKFQEDVKRARKAILKDM